MGFIDLFFLTAMFIALGVTLGLIICFNKINQMINNVKYLNHSIKLIQNDVEQITKKIYRPHLTIVKDD